MTNMLVKNSSEEKAVAKKALAALTRLRQGGNPFRDGVLQRMEDDRRILDESFDVLNIPRGYDNTTLDCLQRISRGEM